MYLLKYFLLKGLLFSDIFFLLGHQQFIPIYSFIRVLGLLKFLFRLLGLRAF